MRRRFELVEGSSSKFWQIDVSGASLTTTFGKRNYLPVHIEAMERHLASRLLYRAVMAKVVHDDARAAALLAERKSRYPKLEPSDGLTPVLATSGLAAAINR